MSVKEEYLIQLADVVEQIQDSEIVISNTCMYFTKTKRSNLLHDDNKEFLKIN